MGKGSRTDFPTAALAMSYGDAGYSSSKISELTGLPGRTVRDICARHDKWGDLEENSPVFAKVRHEQNKTLESAFRTGAATALTEAFKPEKLEKAQFYQLVIGAGILTDKARLLAGESTSITEHVNVNKVTLADKDEVLSRVMASMVDVTPQPASTNINTDTDTDIDTTRPASSDHNKP